MVLSLPLLLVLSVARLAFAHKYCVTDTFTGSSFFNGFDWIAIEDPTHGRVNYVDQHTARDLNLSFASDHRSPHFILRADYTTILDPNGPGRNSVRMSSKKLWGHNSVLVADILHMPQGCGTWPALWSFGDPWPEKGEIDIIEGVNDQGVNAATLHTTAGCIQPGTAPHTGEVVSTDCNWQVNYNQGCSVKSDRTKSYGPTFNNNGGGWYAVERTPSAIKVWFWARNDRNVPSDVRNGAPTVDTGNWGTPFAHFVTNSQCDINAKFGAHNIIINLTFCGDWAGNVYSSSGCPGSCVDYVNNNPSAFRDAYWDFTSLRIYEAETRQHMIKTRSSHSKLAQKLSHSVQNFVGAISGAVSK